MTFYNLQNSLKLPPKIQKMEVSMDLDVSRAFVARFVPPPPPPCFLILAHPCLKCIHETNKLDVLLDQGRI